jgi:hypothetical protein
MECRLDEHLRWNFQPSIEHTDYIKSIFNMYWDNRLNLEGAKQRLCNLYDEYTVDKIFDIVFLKEEDTDVRS